jgi:hypothetical protein
LKLPKRYSVEYSLNKVTRPGDEVYTEAETGDIGRPYYELEGLITY